MSNNNNNKNTSFFINNNNNNAEQNNDILGQLNIFKNKIVNGSTIKFSSIPSYTLSTSFFLSSLYFFAKNKKVLGKISIISSGTFLLSGALIDNKYENVGSLTAGGLSSLLAGTTMASGIKHKKIFPILLGSLCIYSLGYHAFFSLYNNIDDVKYVIDQHNEKLMEKESDKEK